MIYTGNEIKNAARDGKFRMLQRVNFANQFSKSRVPARIILNPFYVVTFLFTSKSPEGWSVRECSPGEKSVLKKAGLTIESLTNYYCWRTTRYCVVETINETLDDIILYVIQGDTDVKQDLINKVNQIS